MDHAEVRLSEAPKQVHMNLLVESIMENFYKKHVIPFASFPSSQRPDVEMMIGMYRNHELSLITTEKTVVISRRPYEAIGIGCTYAKPLLDKFWDYLPAKELEVLAAYVVFMVKESVEGCGKYTTIATIHGSRMVDEDGASKLLPPETSLTYTPWNHIDQWERNFKTTWAHTEKDTIMKLIKEDAYGATPEKFRKKRPGAH